VLTRVDPRIDVWLLDADTVIIDADGDELGRAVAVPIAVFRALTDAPSVAALQERVRELSDALTLENNARNRLLDDYWALREQLAVVTRRYEERTAEWKLALGQRDTANAANRELSQAHGDRMHEHRLALAELAASQKRIEELEDAVLYAKCEREEKT
jgi:hypothetical protein